MSAYSRPLNKLTIGMKEESALTNSKGRVNYDSIQGITASFFDFIDVYGACYFSVT
jgi:hypothetical protein